MTQISRWWDAILDGFTRAEPLTLEPLVVLLVLAAAVAVSIPRLTWRFFGLYVTYVHELGHAVAALTTGRLVRGIRLRLDHSGEMISAGRGRASQIWAGFWGYPAPAIAGAAMVWAAAAGWASAALSIGALVLLVSLVFIRNLTGAVVAVACAAAAQALVVWGAAWIVSLAVLVLGIGLCVGSVRDWFKVVSVHVRGRYRATSDAYLLRAASGVPSVVWLAGFALVIWGGAFWAGHSLLRIAGLT
ncbi:M50 family metallopeptidase [Zhihengliuella flava]|uniref:M50 family peptidase n=1 Tax=Zhihengliuella flava TaxID=1285193 RepID=A0A931D8N0_9MICC|nr:M50 family metallopeptidase [Zhihengliuella flava]MBG6084414.1 hypothetical protein [Zhihengliuella flava]